MDVKITIDNTDEIIRTTNEALYNALEIIGNKAADYAAGLAPVDTGNLRNSLTSEVDSADKAVIIGTPVEYARFVEYGTLRQRAQPYLRPPVENHMDEYKRILVDELKTI
jgi:HK97 gp10 family phage protein